MPVIIISGGYAPNNVVHALKNGATDFLRRLGESGNLRTKVSG